MSVFLSRDSAAAGSSIKGDNQEIWYNTVLEKRFFTKLHQCASQPLVHNNGDLNLIDVPSFQALKLDLDDETVAETTAKALSLDESLFSDGFLKLNIGGTSYRFTMETINKRSRMCLIHKFAMTNHEARLRLCNGYIKETGQCHKPPTPCLDVLAQELAFWNLLDVFFPECCWSHVKKSQGEMATKKDDPIDEFDNVCCGFVRKRIYNVLDVPESSTAAKIFSLLSILAVILSVLTLILGSIPRFQVTTTKNNDFDNSTSVIEEPHPILEHIEYGCIVFFTFEYLGKMIVAPHRKKLFFQSMNLIDLIAILPTYVELFLHLIGFDTEQLQEVKGALLVMRILRVLRIIRLLKLGRHSTGLQIFAKTIQRSKTQLGMLMVVLAIGVVFFATILYFIEKDEPGTKFTSIPAGFWWCIVTMSTVGYGDMYPSTVFGKMVASSCIACGALVLALPITVMVENFMRVQEEFKNKPPVKPAPDAIQHSDQNNYTSYWKRRATRKYATPPPATSPDSLMIPNDVT